jgi:hypothetical protein
MIPLDPAQGVMQGHAPLPLSSHTNPKHYFVQSGEHFVPG